MKGLDRSLADDGIGSCDKVAQLKETNESLQEAMTKSEEQNAKLQEDSARLVERSNELIQENQRLQEELAAALRDIDQYKRGAKPAKTKTTGKRKPGDK